MLGPHVFFICFGPGQFFLLTLIVSLLGGLPMDLSRIVPVIIGMVMGAVS